MGSFPVDAAEFYARCVPHYDGFLHAWTSDASVRAGYLDWSPERRACFHHEYLLYADNHRSRAAPESGLQQAATWLRPQRRYILQWKLELRARAVPRPEWTRRVEAPLLEAIQALRDRACEASQRWELPLLDALLNGHYPAPPGHGSTAEMLRRLGCDEGRIQRLRLIHAAYELPRGGGEPPHDPVAEDRERVAQLARDALSWCW